MIDEKELLEYINGQRETVKRKYSYPESVFLFLPPYMKAMDDVEEKIKELSKNSRVKKDRWMIKK